jgi:hypothetical protein
VATLTSADEQLFERFDRIDVDFLAPGWPASARDDLAETADDLLWWFSRREGDQKSTFHYPPRRAVAAASGHNAVRVLPARQWSATGRDRQLNAVARQARAASVADTFGNHLMPRHIVNKPAARQLAPLFAARVTCASTRDRWIGHPPVFRAAPAPPR